MVHELQSQLEQANQSSPKATTALAELQKNVDAAAEGEPKTKAQKSLKVDS